MKQIAISDSGQWYGENNTQGNGTESWWGFATFVNMVRKDLPEKVNFRLRPALWEGASHAKISGKRVLNSGRSKGPEVGLSGKASVRAWWKRGCVNWVLTARSIARGRVTPLARSGGPGKWPVGGSAAFLVRSGWKSRSGMRSEPEDIGLESWVGGHVGF